MYGSAPEWWQGMDEEARAAAARRPHLAGIDVRHDTDVAVLIQGLLTYICVEQRGVAVNGQPHTTWCAARLAVVRPGEQPILTHLQSPCWGQQRSSHDGLH